MPLQAVVQTGGKQYRVKAGDVLDVELLDAAPGAEVTLTDVRFLSDGEKATSDKQALAGAKVVAEVESVEKAPKIVVGKFKAKTHYRRKTGHRQRHTRIRVKEVVAG